MSKRGSLNAKRFAGNSWRQNKSGGGITQFFSKSLKESLLIESESKKRASKIKKAKSKEIRSKKRFERLFYKFYQDKSKLSTNEYLRLEMIFVKLESNGARTKAIQRAKLFSRYCRKHQIEYSLSTYLDNNYHLIDYKRQYPELFPPFTDK